MKFQVLPSLRGERTIGTGMTVVQVRLDVVYQGDFQLSRPQTSGALPGSGTLLLQQLLHFILDFFVDLMRYQIFNY